MNVATVISLGATRAIPSARSEPLTARGPVRERFDEFELDEAEALLRRNGKPVTLAPKPFAVLCAARTPGNLVTKDGLLDLVWGHRFVTESALKTAVSDLCAALDDDSKESRYIETVSRRGYRFIASTKRAAPYVEPAFDAKIPFGSDHAALATLTALCRGDAAVAELIRAVAAMLERDSLALNQS